MALTLVLVSFSCTGLIGFRTDQVDFRARYGPCSRCWPSRSCSRCPSRCSPCSLAAEPPAQKRRLAQFGQVVLGFLELALGLKFLSVAEKTTIGNSRPGSISGAVDRHLLAAGLYLLGKLRFKHDSE
ncbi:MAG: hypothetical protein ACLTTP_08455 [Alistipes ihumii]